MRLGFYTSYRITLDLGLGQATRVKNYGLDSTQVPNVLVDQTGSSFYRVRLVGWPTNGSSPYSASKHTPGPSLSFSASGPLPAAPDASSLRGSASADPLCSSAESNRIEESSVAAGERLGARRGMASGSSNGEPSTAPQANRWYDLRLGSSYRDPSPTAKFCTLRCKPFVPFLPLLYIFFGTQPAAP